jgi:putative endonuclease
MATKCYFVYVLASVSRTLYVGLTGDLRRRLSEHRAGDGGHFTKRYRVHHLVYCEAYGDVRDALTREKQVKGWRRSRKIALVNVLNPRWLDLADSSLPEP